MKKIGLALLVAAAAPSAFAVGTYAEVWNPPEARATTPRHVRAAHKFASHRHAVPRAVKVHARRALMPAPKLVAHERHMQEVAPANEPDMSEIPRQLTPEGNVLRVSSRGASAGVRR